jgi:hypothetical protein
MTCAGSPESATHAEPDEGGKIVDDRRQTVDGRKRRNSCQWSVESAVKQRAVAVDGQAGDTNRTAGFPLDSRLRGNDDWGGNDRGAGKTSGWNPAGFLPLRAGRE